MTKLPSPLRHLGLRLVASAALLLLASPTTSFACAVCMAGREDENRLAFLLTTALLSVLPLVLVGGVIYAFWRRLQRAEREAESAEDAGVLPFRG